MTLLTDSNNTVGFYIPSYKRYDKLHDKKLLSAGCTYIVRKSEQQLYEAEGVDVIAVEDDKINSLGKVRQWIIDNAKEDVVIQIDDDVEKLSYMFKQSTVYLTESQVIDELMRISQILIDLELGFASLSMNPDPRRHVSEFLWKAITGVHTPAASRQSGPSASAPGVREGAQAFEHSRSGEKARSH